ncbi:MAG TPA: UDP-N-acetylglucosamine 2-epimerase (non-hydrolyzing), partial [Deltaproteobacteria bacterium]|nr:UDP-N-acetylglucosamine 2-epimerase (non-hydrolyzing) [Deltaproteobacteria bacterium]
MDNNSVIHIVGARPQFIKLSPVLRALDAMGIASKVIHTGQHYDYEMSSLMFEELGLKEPEYNLGVGSSTHGRQTAEMLSSIEAVLIKESPPIVLVYGDTNSTLAG